MGKINVKDKILTENLRKQKVELEETVERIPV